MTKKETDKLLLDMAQLLVDLFDKKVDPRDLFPMCQSLSVRLKSELIARGLVQDEPPNEPDLLR